MTTSEAAIADPSSMPSDARFRYYQQPPKTVFLKWMELADLLPAEAAIAAGNHEGMIVGLPAEEIFQSITPRIRYIRLVELLPEGFLRLPEEKHHEYLHIPPSRVAKHYQLITLREQLPEEPKPQPPPSPKPEAVVKKVEAESREGKAAKPESAKPDQKDAPIPSETKEAKSLQNIAATKDLPKALEVKTEIPIKEEKPMVPSPVPQQENIATIKPVIPPPLPPEAVLKTEPPKDQSPAQEDAVSKSAIPKPSIRTSLVLPKAPVPPTLTPQVLPIAGNINPQQKRRLFDRLPLFRKKPPAPPTSANNAVLLQQPTPEQISSKLIPPAPVAKFIANPSNTPPPPPPPTLPVEKMPGAPPDLPPATTDLAAPRDVVMQDHGESPTDQRANAEIPDQESLQALFMTEEPLTIERTVELCSALPGIRACILARGAGVIASANVPNGIDILNLSTNAMTMLRQMQDSLQKMGIGSIPAVTLHSEKGLVSVLPHEDLCFLVVHKDRPFIPGVRQRLLDALRQLSHANLPLAIEGASQKPPESST